MASNRTFPRNLFYTAPDGRRLFYPYGLFTRPYVVPDAAVEDQVTRRAIWLLAVYAVLALVMVIAIWALSVPDDLPFVGVDRGSSSRW
jgi:hypothetical protein